MLSRSNRWFSRWNNHLTATSIKNRFAGATCHSSLLERTVFHHELSRVDGRSSSNSYVRAFSSLSPMNTQCKWHESNDPWSAKLFSVSDLCQGYGNPIETNAAGMLESALTRTNYGCRIMRTLTTATTNSSIQAGRIWRCRNYCMIPPLTTCSCLCWTNRSRAPVLRERLFFHHISVAGVKVSEHSKLSQNAEKKCLR